jgi:hypothetical protein
MVHPHLHCHLTISNEISQSHGPMTIRHCLTSASWENTYTILLTGDDTDRRNCLIEMHIPPGGGPPPHRQDLEGPFTILQGEIEVTFRGVKSVLPAGQSRVERNIPSYPFTLCPGVGFEWRLPSESCIFFVHAIALVLPAGEIGNVSSNAPHRS